MRLQCNQNSFFTPLPNLWSKLLSISNLLVIEIERDSYSRLLFYSIGLSSTMPLLLFLSFSIPIRFFAVPYSLVSARFSLPSRKFLCAPPSDKANIRIPELPTFTLQSTRRRFRSKGLSSKRSSSTKFSSKRFSETIYSGGRFLLNGTRR